MDTEKVFSVLFLLLMMERLLQFANYDHITDYEYDISSEPGQRFRKKDTDFSNQNREENRTSGSHDKFSNTGEHW